jgi:gliding motility-associated lipoprotein GldH
MPAKKVFYITFFYALIFLLLLSCDKNRVFEKNVKIPGNAWQKSNIIHFNVNISDTSSSHNVYINLRNRSQYAYSNIFMFITMHAPSGESVRDTFEITLADDRGRWLGRGIGNALSNQVLYLQNVRFPYRGVYVFDIEQAMWDEKLENIIDIGLRIEK